MSSYKHSLVKSSMPAFILHLNFQTTWKSLLWLLHIQWQFRENTGDTCNVIKDVINLSWYKYYSYCFFLFIWRWFFFLKWFVDLSYLSTSDLSPFAALHLPPPYLYRKPLLTLTFLDGQGFQGHHIFVLHKVGSIPSRILKTKQKIRFNNIISCSNRKKCVMFKASKVFCWKQLSLDIHRPKH